MPEQFFDSNTGGDPLSAIAGYAEQIRSLYRNERDIPQMLACGKEGIAHHLKLADALAEGQPELALKLKAAAKALAFNVAANCWPGWGDEGVSIDDAHIEEAIPLAELSTKLVEELGLGPQQLGTGFWLVGALHLAAGRRSAALSAFETSHRAFAANGDTLETQLVDGYVAIANGASEEGAAPRLHGVVSALKQAGSDKAKFFRAELETAERILGEHCGVPEHGRAASRNTRFPKSSS